MGHMGLYLAFVILSNIAITTILLVIVLLEIICNLQERQGKVYNSYNTGHIRVNLLYR